MKSKIPTLLSIGRLLLLLSCCFYFIQANAQQVGRVTWEGYGISFHVPNGWIGHELPEGYVLIAENSPGFMSLSLNSFDSPTQLKAEMVRGITEGDEVNLNPIGDILEIDSGVYGAHFAGTIESDSAIAYGLAILNAEGFGVNVLAATNVVSFGDILKEDAILLAKSLVFDSIKTIDVGLVGLWQERLSQMTLNLLPDCSGNQWEEGTLPARIDLGADGQFRFSDPPTQYQKDTRVNAMPRSPEPIVKGTWEIQATDQGGAKLLLHLEDGGTVEFHLDTAPQGHVYLDGTCYAPVAMTR
ncbi:hypothetical protein ADIS_4076 [Lunatimonas lonarensis]|uniref:Uncharacterized protein n=1 Tax=Lunatimonas lonarensis TaxID=1232681 RepID=R7ZMR4_9BACT|nr:hypothetical protein [Lunatimonas lonarensis]EON75372.1 hypothetical protein ADIS_4076 [Lunatimonas lonarensis]